METSIAVIGEGPIVMINKDAKKVKRDISGELVASSINTNMILPLFWKMLRALQPKGKGA